jgi:hypothetical protein
MGEDRGTGPGCSQSPRPTDGVDRWLPAWYTNVATALHLDRGHWYAAPLSLVQSETGTNRLLRAV